MTTTDDVDIERRAGGPASRAGKRESVLRALAATADRGERRSDRAIAKLCGVSQPFVSKLRRSLDAPATKKDTQLNDVNAVLDDTGVAPDLAAAANDPLIEPRAAHARVMADSVRAVSLLPGGLLLGGLRPGGPRPGGDEPDGTGGTQPPAPVHTFMSLMGIVPRQSHADDEDAPRESPAHILVDDDVPACQEEERDTEIMVVTRPAPRAVPETRALPELVYEDEWRALQRRLQIDHRHHDRLIEKVARGDATAAELAVSRKKMRDLKDEIADAESLQAHARRLAVERAERDSALRYHETIDRTASEFAELVDTASEMDRLITELGAARERYHALLEGGLVELRSQASKIGGQRRALEALTAWTGQGEGPGLEHELTLRLRAVGVLRSQGGVDPDTAQRRLTPWAETWTARALDVARAHAPAIPEPEADTAEDPDAPAA